MSHVNRFPLLVAVLGSLLFLVSTYLVTSPLQVAEAAGTCDSYKAGVAIPSGYGASYNVFSTSKMLVSVYCNDDNTIKVTAGDGDPLTYVYNKGYQYVNGAWQQFTYSCSNLVSGAWCPGEVSKTITNSNSDGFLVSYSCRWNGTKWNCGCRDSACTSNYWQLQGWVKTVYVEPPVSGGNGQMFIDEDFESPDWNTGYRVINKATRETGEAARTGNYGIRMKVPSGQLWGGEVQLDLAKIGKSNIDEVWARYYIRFDDSFSARDWRLGKAGFRANSNENCVPPCLEGTDTYYEDKNNPSIIRGYSWWHAEMTDQNIADRTFQGEGTGKDWSNPSANMVREKWYCVETHFLLNTPWVANGKYQNWVNGVKVADWNANFRNTNKLDIDKVSLITYAGGSWGAGDHTMNVFFDDWAVSDQRIGCE